MKKPYDRTKDFSFVPPSVVRTSRILVGEKNVALMRDFFADLMKKNSAHEVMCFVRKELPDGSVVRESRAVSTNAFDLKAGVEFRYVHTVGVSERIIVNEYVDGGVSQSVYTISG